MVVNNDIDGAFLTLYEREEEGREGVIERGRRRRRRRRRRRQPPLTITSFACD